MTLLTDYKNNECCDCGRSNCSPCKQLYKSSVSALLLFNIHVTVFVHAFLIILLVNYAASQYIKTFLSSNQLYENAAFFDLFFPWKNKRSGTATAPDLLSLTKKIVYIQSLSTWLMNDHDNSSSSSIKLSMTLRPFCQKAGSDASRPNGASSSL